MSEDGRIVGWNMSAERIFGWSAAEAIGLTLSETIVPLAHRRNHENGLSHFHQTGEGPVLGKRLEVPALCRDGSEIPVELSINATEQFGARLFVGFLRDISDRREQAERQQRVLQESEHRARTC